MPINKAQSLRQKMSSVFYQVKPAGLRELTESKKYKHIGEERYTFWRPIQMRIHGFYLFILVLQVTRRNGPGVGPGEEKNV